MSMCEGETYCEIYRDKEDCRAQEKKKERNRCECRHARFLCEVGTCAFREFCGDKGRQEVKTIRALRDAMLQKRKGGSG